ncbi:MAG: valine--tRNA ligase [Candidatus Eremiobacteraeota bacterium]|nr:valine--tRNA ligase [Candidatus Eremiobacteraeota bacterium]
MKTIELEKVYRPGQVEDKWYELWEKFKRFASSPDPDKKPYCIVIPPPNVTGSLHMGHALDNTIQDALIRFKRMRGFEALWIPGTDHAGIATQRVVEKELAKEGKTRWDMGREKFIENVWKWKEKYGGTIVKQLKRMGCSCDWDRERFTFDDGCSRAVREVFVRLYDEGKIYRGKRIVNWCPNCYTALSNLEVEHEENKNGKLYHLKYPLEEGEGSITIATTRPETILADTAVAVNPKDPRYEDLIGKNVILPLVGRKLPIIANRRVEIGFGTGALKITPAHDLNDWEIGTEHDLPIIICMDEKGIMNENAIKYQGMDRDECRKEIVKDLEDGGHLVKTDDYEVSVGTCYRCHTVIEPYLSEQWFVDMKDLAKPAIDKVKDGTVKFMPERFTGIYLDWLENIRDWCISRQLWWGHRVPVWTCGDCKFEGAFKKNPDKCPKCGSENFEQDDFVLDTWFSSGLWPFSTMGWPEITPELEYYYPTGVLVTARDIIFLWVARMMMMGLKFRGEVPFYDVYIHATILNSEGRRMSKSLGTGIDPLELFDKFGADATRFGLMVMTEQGQDIKFSEERIEMSRNFGNKIWNASRFLLRQLPTSHKGHKSDEFELTAWDRWILSKLNRLIKNVTEQYQDYKFDQISRGLYDFFRDNFCDWYIEISKPILYGEDEKAKEKTLWILETVMDQFLRLLHPMMPFLTEEIWSFLPSSRGSEEDPDKMLITSEWPEIDESLIDPDAEKEVELIIDVTRSLRNMRAELKLNPRQKAKFLIEAEEGDELESLKNAEDVISHLTVAEVLEITPPTDKSHSKSLSVMSGRINMFMPLEGLIDIETEVERLNKDGKKLEKIIFGLSKKCENPQFLQKASPDVVERERKRLVETRGQLKKINERTRLLLK